MVLANETVAEYMHAIDAPFVYRIHEKPSEEKAANFKNFTKLLGLTPRFNVEEVKPYDYQNLLKSAEELPIYSVLNRVMLRSMQKARYSHENEGHFGLASKCYCHFTSPIRRYPDLLVHRLLTKYIDEDGRSASEKKYEELCEHSSNMEQIAAQAERASIKYKQVEFMAAHLGQVYDGVISGVTEWGLYVELNENKCEGMIPMRDLDDDYYEFDEKNYCLRGRRHNRTYNLGDAITIRVAKANLEKKQLDFELVE